MPDPEIQALLQITKGQPVHQTTDLNIHRLIRLCFRHKTVYHLQHFAREHRGYFTAEQLSRIEAHSRKIAMQSLTQLNELKTIAEMLNEKNIGYVCIKGPQLSRMLYGREALKESVDLDILLTDGTDLLVVHAILSGSGYTQSNLNHYPGNLRRKIFLVAKREVHYFNKENRCAIDLHIRPGANTYLTEKRFAGFLEDLRKYDLDGTPVNIMKDEASFVYLCYHGALHQFSRLAWLMDVRAFLIQKQGTLDFGIVYDIATASRIWRCVSLVFLLIKQYFNEDYTLAQFKPDNRVMHLASICTFILAKEAAYGSTLKGRGLKLKYVMLLMKGFSAKADWIYGIMVRQLIKLVEVKGSLR
ncbi:MAG TPA: nucleotidyltransferase family protein [Bacteroidales bacterium]|nr:nucleotidyltransferase family protein [Bacteroidales bacterium]